MKKFSLKAISSVYILERFVINSEASNILPTVALQSFVRIQNFLTNQHKIVYSLTLWFCRDNIGYGLVSFPASKVEFFSEKTQLKRL